MIAFEGIFIQCGHCFAYVFSSFDIESKVELLGEKNFKAIKSDKTFKYSPHVYKTKTKFMFQINYYAMRDM